MSSLHSKFEVYNSKGSPVIQLDKLYDGRTDGRMFLDNHTLH